MQNAYQELLDTGLKHHKAGQFKDAELAYNRVLNRLPFDATVNYLLSDLYLRMDYNGLALHLLTNLLQNDKSNAPAWLNLGIAFRKENEYDKAEKCWQNAISIGGETQAACNNMASLYADRAKPHEALQWLSKSLALAPDDAQAHWGKALALLTLRQWEEGWKEYEWRQKLETWDSRKSVEAPIWDGSHVGHLYVHGEQGVGDEVMFASALPMVKAERITVEVNPKVATLIQKSFPYLDVVDKETPGDYDAKVPIASLIGRFGFNKEPYLNPDPWRVKFYREEMEKLGKGPYIALTWMGGVKQTRMEDRSIQLHEMKELTDNFTCISAQHWADHPLVKKEVDEAMAEAGITRINDESCGLDLHEQAALFRAVDCVVTVQQTAVHVAGAVGAKTHCIIGSHPHWRYGLDGETLPWYQSVKLHRKTSDWKEAVSRVCADLRRL